MAACLVLAAGGCDQPPRRASPPPPPPATSPAAQVIDLKSLPLGARTPPRPGYATGRIFDTDGRLLDRPNAKVTVELLGISAATSEKVTVSFNPDADGTYSRKLEPGLYYTPTAKIEFPFDSHTYRLPLVPIGPPGGEPPHADVPGFLHRYTGMVIDPPIEIRLERIPRPSFRAYTQVEEAGTGLVQDFVWRLSGTRPGAILDPEKPEAWIGGSLQPNYVSLRQDIGRVVRPPPPGTRVFFIIRPISLLADGSQGKVIIAERKFEAAGGSLQKAFIHDIPLMKFEARGFEVTRDGKMRPLLFKRPNGSWGEVDLATFPPDLKQSTLSFLFFEFSRQDD
jgi:hypothetical protein